MGNLLRPSRAIASAVLCLFLVSAFAPGMAARTLFLHAKIDLEPGELMENVIISGRVTDHSGSLIPNAAVSIQVNNPAGTIIHAAFTYTGLDGSYQVKFPLPSGAPPGNYSVYVTASRLGFDDDRIQLKFSITGADFSLAVVPKTQTVDQGDAATFRVVISAVTEAKPIVNLDVLKPPAGVIASFTSKTVATPGSVDLVLKTSGDTPMTAHNITIIGIAGGKTKSILAELIVRQSGPFILPIPVTLAQLAKLLALVQLIGTPTIIGLLAVAILVVALSTRRRQQPASKIVREALGKDAHMDKGYLATARALARLEEMRAMGRIDQRTYEKLKDEYEKRLDELPKDEY